MVIITKINSLITCKLACEFERSLYLTSSYVYMLDKKISSCPPPLIYSPHFQNPLYQELRANRDTYLLALICVTLSTVPSYLFLLPEKGKGMVCVLSSLNQNVVRIANDVQVTI